MKRTATIAVLLALCAPTGWAYEFQVTLPGRVTASLTFDEETHRPGVQVAVVTFSHQEEKFGDTKWIPDTKLRCQYDAQGRIVEVTTYAYHSQYHELKREFVTTDETFHSRTRYRYDAAGRVLEKKEVDHAANEPDVVEYRYSAQGDLIGPVVRQTQAAGTTERVFRLHTYQYNDAGQVLHEVEYDEAGDAQEEIEWSYQGAYQAKKQSYVPPNKTVMVERVLRHADVFTYDSQGRLEEHAITDRTGYNEARIRYEYDATGRKIAEKRFIGVHDDRTPQALIANKMEFRPVSSTTFAYDAQGHLVEEVDDTLHRRYQYDAKGQVQQGSVSLLSNGQENLGGRFLVEYTY